MVNKYLCTFVREGDDLVCQNEGCGRRVRAVGEKYDGTQHYYQCGAADTKSPEELGKMMQINLGTRIAKFLERLGIKKKPGCGCERREAKLNYWSNRMWQKIKDCFRWLSPTGAKPVKPRRKQQPQSAKKVSQQASSGDGQKAVPRPLVVHKVQGHQPPVRS